MAGIDKTYTKNYQEYKEFKDWADTQFLTFYNRHTVCIGDWVWNFLEEDFNGGEIPIMNTPTWLDIYLIQNCKSKFVINRMKEVYNNYEELKLVDLTAPPPAEYQKNRKIKIKKTEKTKFPLHKRPYGGKMKWWLQCNNYKFHYSDETNVWSSYDQYYPYDTNTATFKTLKAVVRHLRKQYLPKGLTFKLIGRYVGEIYLIEIK
jgi:hypothetical protein